MTESIFQRYYRPVPLVDRFARDPSDAVDVIIPIIHTNELWDTNLRSIYREVPVKRLLLGADPKKVASRDTLADPSALDAFVALADEARGS